MQKLHVITVFESIISWRTDDQMIKSGDLVKMHSDYCTV